LTASTAKSGGGGGGDTASGSGAAPPFIRSKQRKAHHKLGQGGARDSIGADTLRGHGKSRASGGLPGE
jgi:hypothetical protein